MLTRTLSATAAAALLLTLSACGSGSGSEDSGATEESKGPKSSGTSDWKSIVSPGKASCDYPEDPMGASKEVDAPEKTAQYTGKVPATINTSVGELAITLDADKAPCTVNSFLSLASQDYYDGTSCHRLGANPGFELLQCGDPTGQGTGGPGYTIPDEFKDTDTFPAGTLAMANTGRPDSGGSQFFMVFGDTELPPSYTVFGTLDPAAVKALEKVGQAGVAEAGPDGTGTPKTPVDFETISVD
ncbi:peptidyl-prolyl cis-trans isomerase B (cyclophilin B) [Nocardioides albertanoniae]|uniref:Peptidyl-prolyl cis-trans isomerase B (Cyclophilin B) n=1 Tax=Nocardioides albertanoniae TaxID=1175486 RepID=A0A543A7R8_9ACTN|nr:peptidylprolyl isomerase [Nocardioides albertanoniae]TQL68654.1 peptidyl-prolyl cis-trans isomerase B (cyclophilin B) [Nocardioides albertanoniae]